MAIKSVPTTANVYGVFMVVCRKRFIWLKEKDNMSHFLVVLNEVRNEFIRLNLLEKRKDFIDSFISCYLVLCLQAMIL